MGSGSETRWSFGESNLYPFYAEKMESARRTKKRAKLTNATGLSLSHSSSGAGPIGLVTLAAAHAAGACPIVITESVSPPLLASRRVKAHSLPPFLSLLLSLTSLTPPLSITQSRLDFAKTLVPSVQTVLIERGVEPLDAAKKIKAAAGGIELSLALEWLVAPSDLPL